MLVVHIHTQVGGKQMTIHYKLSVDKTCTLSSSSEQTKGDDHIKELHYMQTVPIKLDSNNPAKNAIF